MKQQKLSTMDYVQHAKDIAKGIGLQMFVMGKEQKRHFNDDDQIRDVYTIKLLKDGKQYVFEFGQSLNDSDHLELSYATTPTNKANKQWRKYGQFGATIFNYEDDVKKEIENIMAKQNFKFWKAKEREAFIKENFKIEHIKGTKPSIYSVLACLQKYDVGTFEDFCGEFGYDTDSRNAEKIYHAVYQEFSEMEDLFSPEELEQLQEIQ